MKILRKWGGLCWMCNVGPLLYALWFVEHGNCHNLTVGIPLLSKIHKSYDLLPLWTRTHQIELSMCVCTWKNLQTIYPKEVPKDKLWELWKNYAASAPQTSTQIFTTEILGYAKNVSATACYCSRFFFKCTVKNTVHFCEQISYRNIPAICKNWFSGRSCENLKKKS
jgi:hypothetical protein